jgi:hypothetical protein
MRSTHAAREMKIGRNRIERPKGGQCLLNFSLAHPSDEVIDFVNRWSDRTELGAGRFVNWLGITSSKFYHWKSRFGGGFKRGRR